MEECVRFLKKEKGSAIRIFRDLLNKLTFKFVSHIRYEERNFLRENITFNFARGTRIIIFSEKIAQSVATRNK